jgi:hypothetical protein
LRLSCIGALLYFNHFYSLVWSHKLKLKIWGRSDQWFLRYFTFIIWGCLSILIFEVVFHWRSSKSEIILSLIRSHELMFKIWGRSYQWLLRYLTFNSWGRLLFFNIWGCLSILIFEVVFHRGSSPFETFLYFGLVT